MCTRAQLVEEVLSWKRTPYHPRGRLKGTGCDCCSLLLCVAVACGLVPDEPLGVYRVDCWAHWTDEQYFRNALKFTRQVLKGIAYRSGKGFPLPPGTLILTRAARGKYLNHGAIVTDWPMIVHSVWPAVEETDATKHELWSFRPIEAYDFNGITEC